MSLEKSSLVTLRAGNANDRNFILATWLRGLYYGDTWFREIPKAIFMENYHNILERVLDAGKVEVVVACLKEDPEVILGYSVLSRFNSQPVVHWVFVKAAWRKIGIAKSLIPKDTRYVTHLTKVGLSLIRRNPGIDFNPFLL
jgi:L-amino acid N-acyltransferase YncA